MRNERIEKILELHYIEYVYINGKLHACEKYTWNGKNHTDFTCMEGWTKKQVYDWLGY